MTTDALVFWIGIVVLLGLSLLVGILRRSNNATQWLSARDSIKFLPLFGSIVSTMIGGAIFVTITTMGFDNGIVGLYLGLAYAFGLVLIGLFAERIRNVLNKTDSETLFHYLGRSLSPRVGRLFSLVGSILFVLAIAGQIIALKEYFTVAQPSLAGFGSYIVIIAIVLLVCLIYTYGGGLRKDIWSDLIQLPFLAAGIILIVAYMIPLPARSILNNIDKELWTVGKYGLVFFVGAILLIVPMLLVRPDIWQRVRAGRNATIARWSFIAAAPIVAGAFFLFTYVGMIAKGLGVVRTDSVLAGIIDRIVPSTDANWAIPIIALAFIAAVISSLDSILNMAGIALVRSKEPPTDEERKTSLSSLRWGVIGAALLGLMLAVIFGDIVNIFVAALSFLMVMAPPILMALFGYEANERCVFWSSIAGLLVLVALLPFIPKTAFVPAVLVGWITFGIWSWKLARTRNIQHNR